MKLNSKNYESLSNKIKSIYSKKPKFINLPDSGEIKKLVTLMEVEGVKGLNNIKEYLQKRPNLNIKSQNAAAVVASVMNAKQDGKKIYLNTGLFNKPISIYYIGNNVKTKCLTNELLNLIMINRRLLFQEKGDLELFQNSNLKSVKIISENFYLNETTVRGYIQDYDPKFSAISAPNFNKSTMSNIISNKPNAFEFFYDDEYISFGSPDVYVVALKNTSDEDILESFNNMQYLKNKRTGEFTFGERKVYLYGDQNLCYIDKEIIPESFCPAFWISDKTIDFSYLFTFELDYNYLFTRLWESEEKGQLSFPENMCYWDSINECFQFLSVFVLTAEFTKIENKNMISNWCDTYFTFKSIIALWKNNQLLLQRILQDFVYAFLNNSDIKRFANLLDKVNKYIMVREELNKNPYASDVKGLFNSLPFAQMINKQLNNEVMGLADRIKQVISNYLDGRKPSSIVEDVRNIVKTIQSLTPKVGLKNAAFPFIVAEGGILGNGINFNDFKSDPIFNNIFARTQNMLAKRQRSKQKMEEMTELLSNYDQILDVYLARYIDLYFIRNKINKSILKSPLKDKIKRAMKADKDRSKKVIEEAMKYKEAGRTYLPKSTKINFLEEILDDSINDSSRKKEIKMEVESESDEEEDIKSANLESSKKIGLDDTAQFGVKRRYNLRDRKNK